jgi:hypothetical protein
MFSGNVLIIVNAFDPVSVRGGYITTGTSIANNVVSETELIGEKQKEAKQATAKIMNKLFFMWINF